MNIVKKAIAFVKRDFGIASSYPLHFVLTFINSFLILFLFYFINKIVDSSISGISKYGGDYFLYVLVGYAFYQYFQLSLQTFSSILQREQLSGCLEAVLSSQTPVQESIIFSSLYSILSSFLHLLIIIIGGLAIFYSGDISVNIGSTVIMFGASLLPFFALGLLSASFIIVLKKGDPITWIITSLNFILGGAFFPVEIMPGWMITFSRFLPGTHALESLRMTIINGAGAGEIMESFFVLVLMGIVLLPLSLLCLNAAVKKAKKDGTLILY